MKTKIIFAVIAIASWFAATTTTFGQDAKVRPAPWEISREQLLDQIYGGWVGMLIGGIEGLPHEWKYTNQPRATLPDFTFLKNGARTDDDNDFEWTHLWFMDKENVLKLPYPRIVEIWKANMNSGIWVANKNARKLMDEGVVPPETGSVARNSAAWFNLSGQFCVESYGLIAPGMPQAAADIGLHYARIAVSEEPLQAAQFWTSLISLRAFHNGSMEAALQLALAAVDPKSCMAEVVADARRLYHAHPDDWKTARQELDKKWRLERRWNNNSTPVNGGFVCLALLYGGDDDFYRTMQLAMAMGHVILKEFHLDKPSAYFQDYVRRYTDLPMLVKLVKRDGRYVPDRFLRATDFTDKLAQANNPAGDEQSSVGRRSLPPPSAGVRDAARRGCGFRSALSRTQSPSLSRDMPGPQAGALTDLPAAAPR